MDLGKESLQVALDFFFKPVVFVLLLLRLVSLFIAFLSHSGSLHVYHSLSVIVLIRPRKEAPFCCVRTCIVRSILNEFVVK